MKRGSLGVVDFGLWLAGIGIAERGGNPWVSAGFLLPAFALLLYFVFTSERIARTISAKMRWLFAFIIMCVVSGGTVCYVRKYVREHTPWCYGFFYRAMASDGSPSDTWLFSVTNPTSVSAHNVNVTVLDVTGFQSGSRITSPPKQPTFRYSVVYPYGSDPTAHCRAALSPLRYEKGELGKEYQVTLTTDDGEEVIESLVFQDGTQCLTVRNTKDHKELMSNKTPPFDEFGGCG